jgi:type I restriction enzyme, S subunit
MKDWKECKLNELGKLGRGKSKHRPRNDASLYGGRYPFVQTGDIKAANFYITEYSQTYNDKGLLQSKLWPSNTLCITIAANIAETAILRIDACFPDSIIGFIADENKSDVHFIKYHFDLLKIHLQSISQGTTQDNLSQDKLLTFTFTVPEDVRDQRRIASILSSYDDLIEINNQRINLLEETARELYKEWFIRLRFPGYEEVKFVKGLPSKWEIKKVGDVIELAYGKALKEENRKDGPFLVYGSSGIVGNHNSCIVKAPGIVVGRKGNVGSVFWVTKDFYPIDTAFYVKTKISLYYSFFNLQHQHFIEGDAAVPGLNRNQAYSNYILIPPEILLDKFDKIIKPIFDLKDSLQQQNIQLRQIRDRLLPRLISGKLEVKIERPTIEPMQPSII